MFVWNIKTYKDLLMISSVGSGIGEGIGLFSESCEMVAKIGGITGIASVALAGISACYGCVFRSEIATYIFLGGETGLDFMIAHMHLGAEFGAKGSFTVLSSRLFGFSVTCLKVSAVSFGLFIGFAVLAKLTQNWKSSGRIVFN